MTRRGPRGHRGERRCRSPLLHPCGSVPGCWCALLPLVGAGATAGKRGASGRVATDAGPGRRGRRRRGRRGRRRGRAAPRRSQSPGHRAHRDERALPQPAARPAHPGQDAVRRLQRRMRRRAAGGGAHRCADWRSGDRAAAGQPRAARRRRAGLRPTTTPAPRGAGQHASRSPPAPAPPRIPGGITSTKVEVEISPAIPRERSDGPAASHPTRSAPRPTTAAEAKLPSDGRP